MKVKSLHLQNYGRFEDLKIDFAPTAEKSGNVTVIVGNNGAGKSQILQALATSLSWFVNGLKDYSKETKVRADKEHGFLQSNEGKYIKQSQIKNNTKSASLNLWFSDLNNEVMSLDLNATKKQVLSPASYGIKINSFDFLIKQYAEIFKHDTEASLPIAAFYPVDRGVNSISMEVKDNVINDQLTAYDEALKSSASFESFFSWFREREDIENEGVVSSEIKDEEVDENRLIKEVMESDKFQKIMDEAINDAMKDKEAMAEFMQTVIKGLYQFEQEIPKLKLAILYDKQLNVVRLAIEAFTSLSNPVIRRQPKPTMIVEKDGEELDVNQLSQGEKSLLALVGDIARRLALLNPSLDNPLEGEGVVMIDEVDLHLHPKWQHDLIDKLVATFPNVQFILTTHSPHVISDRNDILLYSLDDGELIEMPNVYGEDVNTVLSKIFDVPIRDPKAQADFDKVAELIYEKKFKDAENYIIKLEKQMPENLELLRCRLYLTQAQLVEKQEG